MATQNGTPIDQSTGHPPIGHIIHLGKSAKEKLNEVLAAPMTDKQVDSIKRSKEAFDKMTPPKPITPPVTDCMFKHDPPRQDCSQCVHSIVRNTPPVEAVELEEVLVKLLHKHDHEPDAITRYVVIDQTEFVPSAIQVIMELLQTEITKAKIEELEGIMNYPGQTVDAWADVAHQCILDRIAQLKGQSDV